MESGNTGLLEEKLTQIKRQHPKKNCCLLISSENLVNALHETKGQNIHRVFAQFFDKVEVLYYIKRQDTFILSAWQQWGYKQGQSFQQYMDHCLKVNNPNYFATASFFSDLYGKNNVSVIPLHPSALLNGNLLSDFFSRLHVNIATFKLDNKPSNKSINPLLCELLSRSSDIFIDIHDERIKNQLTKLLGRDSLIFSRYPGFVSDEEQKTILSRFHDENYKLHRHFFNKLDFETLFGYIPSTAPNKSFSDLEIEKIQMLLAMQNEMMIKIMLKL